MSIKETVELCDFSQESDGLERLPNYNIQSVFQLSHFPQCSCSWTKQSNKRLCSKALTSCPNAQSWLSYAKIPHQTATSYLNFLNTPAESTFLKHTSHQISIDLPRTFPKNAYFSKGKGKEALGRVLYAFANFNPQVGYVQGINFIAAALLWHSTEVDAFWLLVSLMEDYGLKENYLPSMPGLGKHVHVVEYLVLHHMPDLYKHLLNYNISVQMFANDWCLTLFACIVPYRSMKCIFDCFFKYSWSFFYKLVLTILNKFKKQILRAQDIVDIISSLKPYKLSRSYWRTLLTLIEKHKVPVNWKKLCKKALNQTIDEQFIICLFYNYSCE